MRFLTAMELLEVWDLGQALSPTGQAIELLRAACPEESRGALASLSVGERDGRLLTLREWAFGPTLHCQAACPACGEQLETSLRVTDIRRQGVAPSGELEAGGYRVASRAPTSEDLMAVERAGDAERARAILLERCVEAWSGGASVSWQEVPEGLLRTAIERMGEQDPQANVRLAWSCPACGHGWSALFDVVSYFWTEAGVWARRLIRDVHTLASAYGWSERDIVSMSPYRRQMYLDLIEA